MSISDLRFGKKKLGVVVIVAKVLVGGAAGSVCSGDGGDYAVVVSGECSIYMFPKSCRNVSYSRMHQ